MRRDSLLYYFLNTYGNKKLWYLERTNGLNTCNLVGIIFSTILLFLLLYSTVAVLSYVLVVSPLMWLVAYMMFGSIEPDTPAAVGTAFVFAGSVFLIGGYTIHQIETRITSKYRDIIHERNPDSTVGKIYSAWRDKVCHKIEIED